MRHRRLPVAAAVAALVLAATGCAGDSRTAIEVNGDEMTQEELFELADLLADDPQVSAQLGLRPTGDGVHDGSTISFALLMHLREAVATDVLEARGGQVLEEDEATAREQIGQIGEELGPVAVDMFAPLMAMSRVVTADGEDPNVVFAEAVSAADVEVDPRFGTWVDGDLAPPGT